MSGQNNFDRVRYEYFRDRAGRLRGLQGRHYHVPRGVHLARLGDGYDFPAVRDGRVKRETMPDDTPSGTQGWFFNMRREKFQDQRVREALGLAFDFEWTNTEHHVRRLQAHGLVLRELRHEGRRASPRRTSWRCWSRSAARSRTRCSASPSCRRCRTARARTARCCAGPTQLLREAGCKREGNVLRLPSGEPLEIEFLDFSGSLQPHTARRSSAT